MLSSAQLDNEKQSLVYLVDLLKDQLSEHMETHIELCREHKDKCRVSYCLNSFPVLLYFTCCSHGL